MSRMCYIRFPIQNSSSISGENATTHYAVESVLSYGIRFCIRDVQTPIFPPSCSEVTVHRIKIEVINGTEYEMLNVSIQGNAGIQVLYQSTGLLKIHI